MSLKVFAVLLLKAEDLKKYSLTMFVLVLVIIAKPSSSVVTDERLVGGPLPATV